MAARLAPRHARTSARTCPARAWFSRDDARRSWKPWLRGTALGFPFGAMPTGGAEIPTFLSYATERRLAPGAPRRSSARARSRAWPGPRRPTTPPSPACSCRCSRIGIPTSATAAILIAAFQIFDLQPGPQLFEREPRARVGADRLAVRGQRDAARAQPAADPAVGEGARDPAPGALHGHPRVRHARRVLDLGLGHRGAGGLRASACSASSCAATTSRSRPWCWA